MEFLIDLLQILGGFIVGGLVGFFVARHYMQKYMKQNLFLNRLKTALFYLSFSGFVGFAAFSLYFTVWLSAVTVINFFAIAIVSKLSSDS